MIVKVSDGKDTECFGVVNWIKPYSSVIWNPWFKILMVLNEIEKVKYNNETQNKSE